MRDRLEASEKNSIPTSSQVDSQPIDLDIGERKNIQIALAQMGFDPGPADGQFGPRTRNAISEARRNFGLSDGEFIDTAFLKKLPDVSTSSASPSKKARRYTLSELPKSADPRLRNAVEELENFEIRFGYYNGKLYLAVLTYGHAWEESPTFAERAGGNLVTITSRSENAFVYRLFASDDRFVYQKQGGAMDRIVSNRSEQQSA